LEGGVAQQFTVNGKNQFTATGTAQTVPVRFAGTVSANSTVTLAGRPATGTAGSLSWEKTLTLATGTHGLVLLATETNPPPTKPAETTRRKVNLTLTPAPAASFAYDDNGSLTATTLAGVSAGYEWDAANRLSAIVKDGKRSEITCDGLNRWVRIVEKDGPTTAATVLSTRRIVWEGYTVAQFRDYDANGTLTGVRHIFGEGEVRATSLAQTLASGTALLYVRDHLCSLRELVNATDLAMRARYDYDPYGKRTKLAGDLDCDFGFTGHYEHPTGLTFAPLRAYDSRLGRWLSRDPLGEEGGINLYGYVGNSPVNSWDSLGLSEKDAYEIVVGRGGFEDQKRLMEMRVLSMPSGWLPWASGAVNGYWALWNDAKNLGGANGGTGDLSCHGQAVELARRLKPLTEHLDAKWRFEVVREGSDGLAPWWKVPYTLISDPSHFYVRATSSNPSDPSIRLDAFKNDWSMKFRK